MDTKRFEIETSASGAYNGTIDVRVRVTGAANNNIIWFLVANVYSVSA